jgi:hypothetical protein
MDSSSSGRAQCTPRVPVDAGWPATFGRFIFFTRMKIRFAGDVQGLQAGAARE